MRYQLLALGFAVTTLLLMFGGRERPERRWLWGTAHVLAVAVALTDVVVGMVT